MRATGRANVWVTDWARVRVTRGRANGMLGEASILWKVGWEMVET